MPKIKTKVKKRIEEVKNKYFQWTFEVSGTYNPDGDSNFLGKVKDEAGRVVMTIKEDPDFNQLSRLIRTSKYLTKPTDMKGLAEYIWDRNLLPMDPEDKAEWQKKKRIPIDVKYITVI